MIIRALLIILAAIVSSPAFTKDQPFTPQWSGIWSDDGQVRCAIQVEKPAPSIVILCQFGRDAVHSGRIAVPAFGEPVFLYQAIAEFGMSYAGEDVWGYIRVFAVCSGSRAEVIGAAYTEYVAMDFRLFRESVAGNPCSPALSGAQ